MLVIKSLLLCILFKYPLYLGILINPNIIYEKYAYSGYAKWDG